MSSRRHDADGSAGPGGRDVFRVARRRQQSGLGHFGDSLARCPLSGRGQLRGAHGAQREAAYHVVRDSKPQQDSTDFALPTHQ